MFFMVDCLISYNTGWTLLIILVLFILASCLWNSFWLVLICILDILLSLCYCWFDLLLWRRIFSLFSTWLCVGRGETCCWMIPCALNKMFSASSLFSCFPLFLMTYIIIFFEWGIFLLYVLVLSMSLWRIPLVF